jgi:hypothetical protein
VMMEELISSAFMVEEANRPASYSITSSAVACSVSAARSVRAPSRFSQRKCRSRAAQILQNINSPEISRQCVRLYLRIQVIGRRRNSSQSQCV